MIAGLPPTRRTMTYEATGTVTVVLSSDQTLSEAIEAAYAEEWTVVAVFVHDVDNEAEATAGDVFLVKCRELDEVDMTDLGKEAPEPIELPVPAHGPHADAAPRSFRQPLLLVVGRMARPPPAVVSCFFRYLNQELIDMVHQIHETAEPMGIMTRIGGSGYQTSRDYALSQTVVCACTQCVCNKSGFCEVPSAIKVDAAGRCEMGVRSIEKAKTRP